MYNIYFVFVNSFLIGYTFPHQSYSLNGTYKLFHNRPQLTHPSPFYCMSHLNNMKSMSIYLLDILHNY